MRRLDVGRRGLAAQVLGLGGDAIEQRRRDLVVDGELRLAQVLGEDRRRRSVRFPQVEERHARIVGVRRMMIDDHVRHDPLRQGVVGPAGLRVDEGDLRVTVESHLAHRHEIDVEIGPHGAVLGATHDAAEGDVGRLLE